MWWLATRRSHPNRYREGSKAESLWRAKGGYARCSKGTLKRCGTAATITGG